MEKMIIFAIILFAFVGLFIHFKNMFKNKEGCKGCGYSKDCKTEGTNECG